MKLPVNYNKLSQQQRASVRREYIFLQNNLCYHCKGSLDNPSLDNRPVRKSLFPPNFFKWPTHLHHCHRTGMTIGAVHNHCNAVLWQYHGE
jgi:hypothetical protein